MVREEARLRRWGSNLQNARRRKRFTPFEAGVFIGKHVPYYLEHFPQPRHGAPGSVPDDATSLAKKRCRNYRRILAKTLHGPISAISFRDHPNETWSKLKTNSRFLDRLNSKDGAIVLERTQNRIRARLRRIASDLLKQDFSVETKPCGEGANRHLEYLISGGVPDRREFNLLVGGLMKAQADELKASQKKRVKAGN